jgi:endonuclease YncB( thermonuclease family)
MANEPALSGYKSLLGELSELIETAHKTVAQTYWKIGKRLVEVEQGGREHARYGAGLLERLSQDLSARHGPGYSVNNLERMRSFYLSHPKSPAPGILTWTHYAELMPVRDDDLREELEHKAEEENLSTRQIRRLVRGYTARAGAQPRKAPEPIAPLKRPGNLTFRSYREANTPAIEVPNGHALVDCGFYVYRLVRKPVRGCEISARPSYTYQAIVERVVDGDTVWALINVGFDTVLREKLRFHGVDAPELTTAEGKQATEFVEKLLPAGAPIVIRSYASDAFGRFMADVFYLPPPIPGKITPSTFNGILKHGTFLNQELLAKGLAKRMMFG